MEFKNYDVKIFLARLDWLKHFPASAQLKFGSASAQTFYRLNFCGFGSGAQVYADMSANAIRNVHLLLTH